MSKPSYPFYPDDWMNDLGLRGCSPAARGVWADLLCMMHQGVPYGYLADASGALSGVLLSHRCGITSRALCAMLTELESHRVFSRGEDGTIFSRRMVRDERNRLARGQGGIVSLLNPAVPRKKGIHEGILQNGGKGILSSTEVVPSFGPEEVKEEEYSSPPVKEKPDWEEVNKAWNWYKSEYPGEVNEFTELRLFLAVIETPQDIADLYRTLPLWKTSKRWQEGYFKESKNFLSERIFRITPKVRDSPASDQRKTKGQEFEEMVDRL